MSYEFGDITINFLQKLRREWKTFAWGLISLIGTGVNFIVPFIPSEYQGFVAFVIPAGFFMLRQWVDKDEQ
jgi:uncharacterized protein involved in cysteine biosynthesis